jgi:cytochrome c oxidase subunit 3
MAHEHEMSGGATSGPPARVAHHFESAQQQFDAGKLGMWLFLSTEILLFGGLFCAYAVYRANHPEIFLYAHKYLDSTLGGINTCVLIFSSLTMAWSVRAAQLGQQKLLKALLAITLICGFGFLGIKAVEYSHKWQHGLKWGKQFNPTVLPDGTHVGGDHHGEDAAHSEGDDHAAADTSHEAGDTEHGEAAAASDETAEHGAAEAAASAPGGLVEKTTLEPPTAAPAGLAETAAGSHDGHAPVHQPSNVHIFFGIYFTMTGLHALHVIAGMVVIAWLLVRAVRGDFGPNYFTPVDLGGLYWHLVDLIWIFLFPLLYLIH